jgi:hypothetical protein
LSAKETIKHLMGLSGQWIDQIHQRRKLAKLILDMDSSVSETYGHQEGAAYNSRFGGTCYHPSSCSTSLAMRGGSYRRQPFWGKPLQSFFRVGNLTLWGRSRGPRERSFGKDRLKGLVPK